MSPGGARIGRRAGSAAGIIVMVMAFGRVASEAAAASRVDVFPIAGASVASPLTQITFRGRPAGQLGSIVVRGSRSGAHSGRMAADSDGRGASFIPIKPFKPGEKVTVRTGLDVAGGRHGSFTFTVATPAGRIRAGSPNRVRA